MNNVATTPDEYESQLQEPVKTVVSKLRHTIKQHLPKGFEETITYKAIGYVVPKSIYPAGYHCNPKEPLPFMMVAVQKNAISIHHMGLYANPDLLQWFQNEYPKHCKTKLDMGKGCFRLKKLDDIPYVLIAALVQKFTVADWIQIYERQYKK